MRRSWNAWSRATAPTVALAALTLGVAFGPMAQAKPDPLVVKPLTTYALTSGQVPMRMAINADGSALYAVATDPMTGGSTQAYRIDARTGAVLAQQAVIGAPPRAAVTAIAIDGSSTRLWIVIGPTLFALDGLTLAPLGSWQNWDTQFEALTASPDGARVYGLTTPASKATSLVEIEAASGRQLRSVELTPAERRIGPHRWIANRLALDPSGETAYAVPSDSSDLVVVDTATMGIRGRVQVGEEPASVALSPTAGRAFVSDPFIATMLQVDTETLQVVGTSALPGRCPSWLATDTLGERAVVGNPCGGDPVWVFDPRDGRVLTDDLVGTGMSVWMSPDGSAIYDISTSPVGKVAGYRLLSVQEAKAERARLLPGRPAKVSVSLDASQAVINWQAPSPGKAGGSLQYEVSAKPGGTTCTAARDQRQCVVPGLRQGQVYAFTVRARNAAGWGPRAVSRFVVVPRPPQPTPTPKPSPTFN